MEAKPGLKWHRRSVLWMASALVVLAMKSMLPSSIWDRWYYQGIFIGFRQLYDWVLGWSPLPMVYIVLLIIIVRFANWLGQFKKGFVYQKQPPIHIKPKSLFIQLLNRLFCAKLQGVESPVDKSMIYSNR